jgi:aerobic-type carbon monoxide dehydrogenase small subunit (CoxS/CutS family)
LGKYNVVFKLNGDIREVYVDPGMTLLDLIREDLGLIGAKKGCGTGECGACTVIMNGRAVPSCLVLAASVNGSEVTTIEGLAEGGRLHPLQQAFIDHQATQCGFCTPGFILSAKAFLDENPHPSRLEVEEALLGNLCRCTGYKKIVDAVMSVVEGNP